MPRLRAALPAWATVVVATLIGIVVAAALTALDKPMALARAEIYFSPGATLDASAHARVASYAELVDGRDGVRARVLADSLVVRLTARADDAATAQRRVESTTALLQSRASSLETATRGLTATVVRPGSAATTRPPAPWLRNLLLGAVAGALVGLACAAALRRRPRRLRSADDVTALLPLWTTDGLPVAGQVAALVHLDDPSGAFDRLAEGLRYVDVDVEGTTLVVASSRPGHDAAEVAVRLAEHLAASGEPVALVDAAFSRPEVAGLLGLDAGTGLVSVLAGRSDLTDAVVLHGPTGIHVLPGATVPDPASLTTSRALHRVLSDLRREHSTVLVVADALTACETAALLAGSTDGLLLVLREQVDTDRSLRHGAETLEARGARLRGVALTRLAGPPVSAPVTVPHETSPTAEPELVFPEVPQVEQPAATTQTSSARIPLQRTPEPEPTAPLERISLLEEFLDGSEEAEPEQEPAQRAARSATDPLSWDEDAESIWRPRTR